MMIARGGGENKSGIGKSEYLDLVFVCGWELC